MTSFYVTFFYTDIFLPVNAREVTGKAKFVPIHAIKAYGEVKA
jgi:hypothetical protein